ncbi:uncharacterized protein [Typha angustifolia]|uniref:uncharacterized protein n=1 Tax=Typha angustifolia TaxID=59011 RepID=UPI003C2F8272
MSVTVSKETNKSSNILTKYVKAPIKALGRARDIYVNGMMGLADRAQHGPSKGLAGGMVSGMPRRSGSRGFYRSGSNSSSSSEDDVRELIRASSRGSIGPRKAQPNKYAGVGPRSHSVAICRIDEDEPCEFDDDVKMALGPRSRSCAVVSEGKVGTFD